MQERKGKTSFQARLITRKSLLESMKVKD